VPRSLSMSLLSTWGVWVDRTEQLRLTLMVVSIVHRTVSSGSVVGRLHGVSVFDGVTSRDVVCGSAVVGGGGVVISCEVAVVGCALTVVGTICCVSG
jgi:hypothetical protein